VGFHQHPEGIGVTLPGPHDQRVAVIALPGLDLHGASVRAAAGPTTM
jgi:hypothetical protein